jgi:hypothetical protein
MMRRFRIAPATWKWLISALVAGGALLMLIDFGSAMRPMLVDHTYGSLGVQLDDTFSAHPSLPGSHTLHILALDENSPLRALGAQPHDAVRFSNPLDRWRRYAVDEKVKLTLIHDDVARPVTAVAIKTTIPFADYYDYWGRFILCVLSLPFCLMIGFKQAENRAYRALAKTFLGTAGIYFIHFHYAQAGTGLLLGKLWGLTLLPLLWHWCVIFALHYQPYRDSRLRTALHRCARLQQVLAYATAAYAARWVLGYEAPGLGLGIIACSSLGLLLTLTSLANGWYQCSGDIRQRHRWLLMFFLIGAVPGAMTWVPAFDASLAGMRITVMAAQFGQVVMYGGLVYAVLKLRVFNFDFAVNRAMVYSIVSVLLLCTVGVMEFLSKSLIKGEDYSHKNLLVDAGIALVVYLVFHQLHGKIEKWVEKIFFYKWHENEHRLRHFVKQAAHITEVDALLSAFRTAIDRFTGQAGCAIYLRQADGSYGLVASTMGAMADTLPTNGDLAVALRADMVPAMVADLDAAVAGELVLPMSHRGTLNGFLILAPKSSAESYRPDECEVLGFCANQIGLDIHALRVETLESEVRALEHTAQKQQLELQLMAGRRRSARQPLLSTDGLQSTA